MRPSFTNPVPRARALGTGAPRYSTALRRMAAVTVVSVAGLLCSQAAAGAAGLAITVPSSANLGSVPTGTLTRSAQLGTVTVTDDRALAVTWTATASSTDLVTGAGTAAETIAKASISYWSGPATASTGLAVRTPGQLTFAQAVTLAVPRTAFSALGTILVANSTSWNPTIVITIPPAAVAGTYTATITHSVA